MIALVGSESQLDRFASGFRDAFPLTWVQHYTTDDIDDQLGSISDQIVRDVRSRAAESLTNELAQFRAAADLGRTVEGADVLEALRHSNVASVLVHDDPDDGRLVDGDRLVDHITHLAVAGAVPIRMIPGLDELRGPAGGLGAVLRAPSAAGSMAMPATLTSSGGATPSVAS